MPVNETAVQAKSRGRRAKYLLLLAVIVGSGIVLLSWTQNWYHLELAASTGHPAVVEVPGQVAAPALTALSLAGIALAGALSIAGHGLRIVFGVLELVLGACVFLSAVLADVDPIQAGASVVTKATGISGHDSVREIVSSVSLSAWPAIAMVGAVLMAASGVAVLVTSRRWPGSSRRYQAVAYQELSNTSDEAGVSDSMPAGASTGNENAKADDKIVSPGASGPDGSRPEDSADPSDPVVAWDDLSRGSDPTT